MSPIVFEHVTAAYPQAAHRAERPAPTALHDINLELHPSQLCAIIGPNGAGKSTVLRVAAGMLAPQEGRVQLHGEDLAQLSRRRIAQQIALVPQRIDVTLPFSVRQVVAMGRAPHQGSMLRATAADQEAVSRAVEACDLQQVAHRPIQQLSGGEQQRVHIARALAQQAPVLLLDEPAAHLDIRHRAALHGLLRRQVANRALSCVAVMHDLSAAADYADRVVILKQGRLLADGPVTEVMTDTLLSEAFDTRLRAGTDPHDGRHYFVAEDNPAGGQK